MKAIVDIEMKANCHTSGFILEPPPNFGDRPVHIEIDGGVDPQTAPLVGAAGADVLIAGSAVFKGGSVSAPDVYGDNIRAIRTAAETALSWSRYLSNRKYA